MGEDEIAGSSKPPSATMVMIEKKGRRKERKDIEKATEYVSCHWIDNSLI